MPSGKQRKKASRRAKKHVVKAWTAVEENNLKLALEESRLALKECQTNANVWTDCGLIFELAGELGEAERALRNALLLAPDRAETYAYLARIAARLDRTVQAARLQRKAVELEPACAMFRAQLETYEALLPTVDERAPSATEATSRDESDRVERFASRLDVYDWRDVRDSLAERGYVVLTGLLTCEECVALKQLYGDDERFEKTVTLAGDHGAGGGYRFFREPLPAQVAQLRSAVYARIATIANDWMERIGKPDRFPDTHAEFLEQCAAAGQSRTTPILLCYRAPAVNHLHQDVWGRVVFPLQLAVTLSARRRENADGFVGGEFVFADDIAGRNAEKWEVPTDEGDAVLFCTRDRLVRVAGSFALQPVLHGMAELTAGERYVLGVPFHSYK